MIESTQTFKEAIIADARKISPRVVINIIDPDVTYEGVESSSQAPWSKPSQIMDKEFEVNTLYATLERGRWILDGSMRLIPDNPQEITENVGFTGNAICGDDGVFPTEQWVEIGMGNISILQACSVYFPENDYDGVAENFRVDVYSGDTIYYTEEFEGNKETSVFLSPFTVYYPTAVRLTVEKWSLPGRRMRIAEFLPGVYERWSGDMIASLSVKHQGDFSCVSLPYGTCEIKIDNQSRRFEPRNKAGIFQSIEDRQGIEVYLGVMLPNRKYEYKMLGVFYQHAGGWKTGDNSLTMKWNLVDVIGLLSSREYIVHSSLPSTLEGWVRSIVSQLGENFENLYHVDPNYSSFPLTADAEDVSGMSCGDLLRYVCMASGTWPRADAETGVLTVEPVWNDGNVIKLDNLEKYPVMKANSDIAAIIFTLNDGSGTKYIISGNSTSAEKTVSIANPFIKTQDEAIAVAKTILSSYGGNLIETVGRGDPSSEVGDIDKIWLNNSTATTARRMQQDFSFTRGALQKCKSILLQADGSATFNERVVITKSGTWTAPSGVTKIRAIMIGGGSGGEDGEDGGWLNKGKDGADGIGGKVYAITIDINDSQTFDVTVGSGGPVGSSGGASTFGIYSSVDGEYYGLGFADISSGDVFARTGVKNPLPNSGDGGKGGKGGRAATYHQEGYAMVQDSPPEPGEPGVAGASGCIIIAWEKVS